MSKAPKKPHAMAALCEVNDHVFAEHPERGAMAVKIVSKGRDGFHGKAEDGSRLALGWDAVRGHKSRALQQYSVVDRGADGALLEDGKGRRRFIAGEVPEPAAAEPPPKPDDPLTGGLDRLSKASAMTLPDGPILLFKSATVANRPGLALVKLTDKAGHTTQRWKRSNPDQPKEKVEPRVDPSKPEPMKRGTPDVRANPADRWKTSDPDAPKPAAPRREPAAPARPETRPAPGKAGSGAAPAPREPDKRMAILPAKPKGTPNHDHDKRSLQDQVMEGDVPPPERLSAEGQAARRPSDPPMENAPEFKNPGVAVDPEKAKLSGGRKQHEPMKHGDTVSFRHENVVGTGKIVASGADGVTVNDGDREHQVRHDALEGAVEPAADDTTGLVSGFADMGQSISANLRHMLWGKIEAGETTEMGKPSAVLIAAKAARDAGQIKDRADFDRFVTEFYAALKKAAKPKSPGRRKSVASGEKAGSESLAKALDGRAVLFMNRPFGEVWKPPA